MESRSGLSQGVNTVSELLEGPESGHPENIKYIEREIEHEQSFEVREAKTRGRTYDMAKDTGYKYHFGLTLFLIIATLIVSGVTFYYISRNEVDGQGAIIIGTILQAWVGGMMIALSWFFGSSMSSQNKSRIMEKELSEDNE